MNIFSFLGISLIELLTIILLGLTLVFIVKNKRKMCMWLISIILLLHVLGNWNMWFNMCILLKNSLFK